VLEASRRRITDELPATALVLDVGGWAKPLERADWVLDLLPYETRGLYGYDRQASEGRERFTPDTWVTRDMCDREPWPFTDGQFDFAVCSHTLEDIRDPVFVCHELQRVAKAGYIEVPAREEEQTFGIHGQIVGWSHHRWLIDVDADADRAITFVGKPGFLNARPDLQFPRDRYDALSDEERVQQLWWSGPFQTTERIFTEPAELEAYLAAIVPAGAQTSRRKVLHTLRRVLR
jgi:hypothetical protein